MIVQFRNYCTWEPLYVCFRVTDIVGERECWREQTHIHADCLGNKFVHTSFDCCFCDIFPSPYFSWRLFLLIVAGEMNFLWIIIITFSSQTTVWSHIPAWERILQVILDFMKTGSSGLIIIMFGIIYCSGAFNIG